MFDLIAKLDAWVELQKAEFGGWFEQTFPALSFLWQAGITPWVFLWIGVALGYVSAKRGWQEAALYVGSVLIAGLVGRFIL